MKRLSSALVALLLFFPLLSLPVPASAHPHIWVDYAVTAVFDGRGLEGFRVVWIFDEMFSEQIREMGGFKKGSPSAAQVRKIREAAFDNLRGHGYFSHIRIDDREFPVATVRDFTARAQGHRMVYEFFIPCAVPAAATPTTVSFLNFDRENFADYTPDRQQPLQIVNPAALLVEAQEAAPGRPLQIRFRKSS